MRTTATGRRGYTLIELLLVISLLSLLTTIALPAYRGQVLRSHRALARATLIDLAAKLEVEALRTGAYPASFDFHLAGSDAALLGLDRYAITASGQVQPIGSPNGLFEIRLEKAAAGAAFKLSATAINAQTDDRACATISLDALGRRRPTAGSGPSGDCWSR